MRGRNGNGDDGSMARIRRGLAVRRLCRSESVRRGSDGDYVLGRVHLRGCSGQTSGAGKRMSGPVFGVRPDGVGGYEGILVGAGARTRRRRIARNLPMCRNIKVLANFAPPATDDEVRASALQFVRKLSGTTRPSKANEAAFNRAVDEVTAAARRLLDSLVINAPPRNREEEARKARERSRRRFGTAAGDPVSRPATSAS